MNPDLLRYYEQELLFLRETGGEFARAFPKIAGRLGLETYTCADPYVERLLEGVAFLAARIQHKLDAEFPKFTHQLLEHLYPNYLAPTPSMAIVKMEPDLAEGSLAEGFVVPRNTPLYSVIGKGDRTACEFRSAHDVTLFPVELESANYFTFTGEINGINISTSALRNSELLYGKGPVRAGLRLRLRATAGLSMNEINLEQLPLYLCGSESLPGKILEQFLANSVGMMVCDVNTKQSKHHEFLPARNICQMGMQDNQALLPATSRSFSGYRLLQEYFIFPQRFLFVELTGLKKAMHRCPSSQVDIIVLFDQFDAALEQLLSRDNFSLFTTPAINLFSRRCDRIHISDQMSEYRLVADRMRPLDFEVYNVSRVQGFGDSSDHEQEFKPFYHCHDQQAVNENYGYYQLRRVSRLPTDRERQQSLRSSYLGGEVYLSLVDPDESPYSSSLRQLGVEALCTNRDLVLSMPLGGRSDFTMESAAPVNAIRCIDGPSMPSPSYAERRNAWRLINHLSLNYISLINRKPGPAFSNGNDHFAEDSASAIQDMLRLYCRQEDISASRQIEGLLAVDSHPVTRRLPIPGPISYARGLCISLTFDDDAFEGAGCFILATVLEQFLAKYISINGFTETVIKTNKRGTIMQWPPRLGKGEIL